MSRKLPRAPEAPPIKPAVPLEAAKPVDLVQTAQFVLNLVVEGEPQPARKAALSQVAKAHLDVLLKAAGAI